MIDYKMIDEEITEDDVKEIVDIVANHILTPVIYMFADQELIEFICFMDRNIADEDIDAVEEIIHFDYGVNCEIVDLRQFSPDDRIQILQNAELVYAVDDTVLSLVQAAVCTDLEQLCQMKQAIIDRKESTGSYYLN